MSDTRHEDDFDPAGIPTRFYAVCTTPRSGSTLLCRSLWRTGRMGAPREYFNPQGRMLQLQKTFLCDDIGQFTDEVLRRRTSPNGVFGLKLFFSHWPIFRQSGRFHRFRDLRLIHLRRSDRIAQAVSHRLAMQTNQWSVGKAATGTAHYDFGALATSMNEIALQERRWAELFARLKVRPLRVLYEDFRRDIDHHVADICSFVGVDPNESAALVNCDVPTRQSSAINIEWAERFRADLARRREGEALRHAGID